MDAGEFSSRYLLQGKAWCAGGQFQYRREQTRRGNCNNHISSGKSPALQYVPETADFRRRKGAPGTTRGNATKELTSHPRAVFMS